MSWLTPIITWVPSPVGNADLNRIEGNIKYLREETATFNGAKTFTNNITQTAGITSLKATIINDALSVFGINPLILGYNQGGGATLKYNINGNLDIISRSGYNTDVTTTRFLINATDNGIDTLQVNGGISATGVATLSGGVIVNGAINPTTTPTSGTWTTSQVIPRGIYNISFNTSGGGNIVVRQNSVTDVLLSTINGDLGGFIASDGINTNVQIIGTSIVTYFKY